MTFYPQDNIIYHSKCLVTNVDHNPISHWFFRCSRAQAKNPSDCFSPREAPKCVRGIVMRKFHLL